MSKLGDLKQHLRPGQVYRRSQLTQWSNAVDRHLIDGTLVKLSGGLYHYPKKTAFGPAPADDATSFGLSSMRTDLSSFHPMPTTP